MEATFLRVLQAGIGTKYFIYSDAECLKFERGGCSKLLEDYFINQKRKVLLIL